MIISASNCYTLICHYVDYVNGIIDDQPEEGLLSGMNRIEFISPSDDFCKEFQVKFREQRHYGYHGDHCY